MHRWFNGVNKELKVFDEIILSIEKFLVPTKTVSSGCSS